MKRFDGEWQELRKKEAIQLIEEMERDEIGFTCDEIWDSVYSFMQDYGCSDPLARRITIAAFRACGYTVE